jgi:hypothetical protein
VRSKRRKRIAVKERAEGAEADAAALLAALMHAARMKTIKGARAIIGNIPITDRPGASLLAELAAARAVIEAVRSYDEQLAYHRLAAYDAAVKANKV